MKFTPDLNPADYIEPLYMNGLHGRMLRLRAKPRKTKEILVVYGQHNSLERLFGMAQSLNRYGGVTIPDLPGFGGMQSFYKLKEKPTVDNLADYLASFVKLRYKNRRLTIIGLSFGFAVVTRMLQKYPELAKKVDLLVCGFGYVHHEDLIMNFPNRWWHSFTSKLLSYAVTANLTQSILLRPSFIQIRYNKPSVQGDTPAAQAINEYNQKRIAYETHLWRSNDLRTHMFVTNKILKLDLCNAQVDLPVHSIEILDDKLLNNHVVEQHLGVIYDKVQTHKSSVKTYQPAEMTESDVVSIFPANLKRLIAKS